MRCSARAPAPTAALAAPIDLADAAQAMRDAGLARGKVTPAAVQQQLFEDRNFSAGVVPPDLLAGLNRSNDVDARGAHLFRTDESIALHGGDEIEGVLNNLGNQFAPGITAQGLLAQAVASAAVPCRRGGRGARR